MDAKHQFKYTYSDTNLEEYSPVEVTFEMPGTATISQMLRNFEQYLRACGYVFDGAFDIVPEGYDIIDEFDGSFYEFEDEPQGGCMADFDKECGCSGAVGAKGKEGVAGNSWNGSCEGDCEEYKNEKLKEWSEGLAKLERDIQEERDLREKASKRADELKQMNERWEKISNEEKASILADVLKASGCYTATDEQYEKESREALEKEVKKNKWFHGICNPPSPDWKKNK